MKKLKFSNSCRCASVAIVSNTTDDFPEPETPVKIVISRLGIRRSTSLRLFSRAPRIWMYSVTRPSCRAPGGSLLGYAIGTPLDAACEATQAHRSATHEKGARWEHPCPARR